LEKDHNFKRFIRRRSEKNWTLVVLIFKMGREGIEPPTRGFSVLPTFW